MSTSHDSGARLARFAQAGTRRAHSLFPGAKLTFRCLYIVLILLLRGLWGIYIPRYFPCSILHLLDLTTNQSRYEQALCSERRLSEPRHEQEILQPAYSYSSTSIQMHLRGCNGERHDLFWGGENTNVVQSRVPRRNDLRKFLDMPGIVWVNKIPFITALYRLALMRRPSGFGKTTFLSTSEFLHESANERPAAMFSAIILNEYMNMIYHDFFVRYAEELDLSDTANLFHPTSRLTFDELVLLLPRSGHKLIILIDNFNWPLLTSTPENYVEISSFLRDCIIDPFRSALDDGYVVGGAIVGQPLEEEPTWVRSALLSQSLFDQIGCDISDEEQARGAFGLGESEGMKFRHNVEYSMRNTFERFSSFMGQKRPSYEWVDCGGNVRGVCI
ncbi:hypothetical protein CPB85DRAFT_1336849 [Mucidula mucida]|nr:hypothetical protein CPB85DRAFT_1336849 [Mucidula mucida]